MQHVLSMHIAICLALKNKNIIFVYASIHLVAHYFFPSIDPSSPNDVVTTATNDSDILRLITSSSKPTGLRILEEGPK